MSLRRTLGVLDSRLRCVLFLTAFGALAVLYSGHDPVRASMIAGYFESEDEELIRQIKSESQTKPIEELAHGVFVVEKGERRHLGTMRTPYWVLLPKHDEDQIADATNSSAPHSTEKGERPQTKFLGADSCKECHRDRYEGYQHTAHAKTSRLPSLESIAGSFVEGKNIYQTKFPYLRFEMHHEDDSFVQCVVIESGGTRYEHSEPMDFVIGSGKMGQTFLNWKGDRLYELPMTYFTEVGAWANSPGYTDGTAHFARPIRARCLECHSTHFASLEGDDSNRYDKEHFILGVSCERCHGPGGDHVEYHRDNPDTRIAQHIVHPGDLSRERSIQICAQCHSGGGKQLQPAFSHEAGKDLTQHLRLAHAEVQNEAGVHTDNQLPRLMKSLCYQKSDMTCATCHDPHQHERGNVQIFSERCQDCHKVQDCGWESKLGERITTRCIECHVPLGRDQKTPIEIHGASLQPLLRDHFITIYPEISDEILQLILQEDK